MRTIQDDLQAANDMIGRLNDDKLKELLGKEYTQLTLPGGYCFGMLEQDKHGGDSVSGYIFNIGNTGKFGQVYLNRNNVYFHKDSPGVIFLK